MFSVLLSITKDFMIKRVSTFLPFDHIKFPYTLDGWRYVFSMIYLKPYVFFFQITDKNHLRLCWHVFLITLSRRRSYGNSVKIQELCSHPGSFAHQIPPEKIRRVQHASIISISLWSVSYLSLLQRDKRDFDSKKLRMQLHYVNIGISGGRWHLTGNIIKVKFFGPPSLLAVT